MTMRLQDALSRLKGTFWQILPGSSNRGVTGHGHVFVLVVLSRSKAPVKCRIGKQSIAGPLPKSRTRPLTHPPEKWYKTIPNAADLWRVEAHDLFNS